MALREAIRRDVKAFVNDRRTGLPLDGKRDRETVALWLTENLQEQPITAQALLSAAADAPDIDHGLPLTWDDYAIGLVAAWLEEAAEQVA